MSEIDQIDANGMVMRSPKLCEQELGSFKEIEVTRTVHACPAWHALPAPKVSARLPSLPHSTASAP